MRVGSGPAAFEDFLLFGYSLTQVDQVNNLGDVENGFARFSPPRRCPPDGGRGSRQIV